MSTSFLAALEARVRGVDSLLCIGLDPHPALLPTPTAQAARELCLRVIAATAPYAAAFKPNSAFFEAFGAEGWLVLRELIATIHAEGIRQGTPIPVILDAKRSDIASTAEAYARAAFEWLNADAITLNPYLGHDALEPFLRHPKRGAFLLCKTSNPGSVDVQDLLLQDGRPLYEHIALLAEGWNRQDNLGLVVGATFPQVLAQLRRLTPHLWFLVPGVGAQGGDLTATLHGGLRPDRLGLLINVSRAILQSPTPDQSAAEWCDKIKTSIRAI